VCILYIEYNYICASIVKELMIKNTSNFILTDTNLFSRKDRKGKFNVVYESFLDTKGHRHKNILDIQDRFRLALRRNCTSELEAIL